MRDRGGWRKVIPCLLVRAVEVSHPVPFVLMVSLKCGRKMAVNLNS